MAMKRIPFPSESYEHPSRALSSKLLINLEPEISPADARTDKPLLSTAGLVPADIVIGGGQAPNPTPFGTGPVWAMNGDKPDIKFVASGTRLYKVFSPALNVLTVVDMGDIGTPSGVNAYASQLMITIAVGINAAVVVVPPNAFVCTMGGTLNQMGGDFPGARSVTYLDGYFVFTSLEDDARFFISELLDPTDYDALDFASSDAVPNALRRIVSLRGELWLMGEKAVEVWYNAGTPDFPFRRQAGGVIPYGCLAPKSVAIGDGSVFWLAENGVIVRSQGYQATRISTHPVEDLVRRYTVGRVDHALFYWQDGHGYYVLTLGGEVTLVYDVSTKQWHRRSSSADGSLPWRPSAVMTVREGVYLGDSVSGRAFFPVPGVATEDGMPIIRQVVMPPLWAETNRAFMSRLEIEMEMGFLLNSEGADRQAPGNILLEWSDDGGLTFPHSRALVAAARRSRIVATRLGSFRQRIFRITTVGQCTMFAVDADIAVGNGG